MNRNFYIIKSKLRTKMCTEKTVYYGFKITKPLTSLGFYLLSLWKVFFLHCNALCVWFHSPLWMFPPSYCDKCPPRGEGRECGRVIFQWFSSNFSGQSGLPPTIRLASKNCARQHITIRRGVNPKNHPISCWLLIATTLLISPILVTVTWVKISLKYFKIVL